MGENIRAALGLEMAEEGDPVGLLTFLRFVNRELAVLQMADFPDPMRNRLASLRADADRHAEFVDGYCHACSFTPLPAGQGGETDG